MTTSDRTDTLALGAGGAGVTSATYAGTAAANHRRARNHVMKNPNAQGSFTSAKAKAIKPAIESANKLHRVARTQNKVAIGAGIAGAALAGGAAASHRSEKVSKGATVSAFGVDMGEVSKKNTNKDYASAGRHATAIAFPGAHGLVAGKKGKKLKAAGHEVAGAVVGGSVAPGVGGMYGTAVGTNRAHRKGYYKPDEGDQRTKVHAGREAERKAAAKKKAAKKSRVQKSYESVGAFGVDMGTVSKADQKQPSTGRVVTTALLPGYHGAVAGKKGRKLGAVGSEVGHAMAGGLAGSTLAAVATRGKSLNAARIGNVAGGYAGAARAAHTNQAKGRYKPEPVGKSLKTGAAIAGIGAAAAGAQAGINEGVRRHYNKKGANVSVKDQYLHPYKSQHAQSAAVFQTRAAKNQAKADAGNARKGVVANRQRGMSSNYAEAAKVGAIKARSTGTLIIGRKKLDAQRNSGPSRIQVGKSSSFGVDMGLVSKGEVGEGVKLIAHGAGKSTRKVMIGAKRNIKPVAAGAAGGATAASITRRRNQPGYY